MTIKLKKFIDSLKESDFNGSNTDSSIQAKAQSFLNTKNYKPFESYKDTDIHNTLLALLYDQI